MAQDQKKLVIRTEEDAFAALRSALEKEFEGQNVSLSFKGWPILTIELEGEGYKSTITPDMAEALVALQSAMNRSYATIVKNHASARHLTDEEKRSIQFKAKVEDGCSLISIDISKFAEALVQATVGKMTGTEVVLSIVGVAIAAGSVLAYKAFLKSSTELKVIEKNTAKEIAMSGQETERLKVFADAMKSERKLQHVRDDFDAARVEVLRGVADADSLTVAGIEMPRKDALIAVSKPREQSREIQLNGTYTVSEASFKHADATKIFVRAKQNGREFAATFQDDSLDQEQLQHLKDAAFSKSEVYLSINGNELRGEVTKAVIISVTPQPIGLKGKQ